MSDLMKLCRCDRVLDGRGMCPHCDGPSRCTKACVDCAIRESSCVVCKTPCGTVRAAGVHEMACRRAETKGKK